MGGKIRDLTGERFGRLAVEAEVALWVCPNGDQKRRWRCRCDCGAVVEVMGCSLKKGATQSCGCLHKERAGDANRTHGLTALAEHGIWAAMKTRCNNPNTLSFKNYGGRGISVCARWDSFENFLVDMGPRPGADFTLERENVNGNYEPGNCRWATRMEQANNTRANRRMTAFGREATLAQWAREFGLNAGTLYQRLVRSKMPLEKALTFRK